MPTSIMSGSRPKNYNCFAKRTELYTQKPWTTVLKRQAIVAEYPTPAPNSMPLPFYIGKQVFNSAISHGPEWTLHQRTRRNLDTYSASPASYSTRNLSSRGVTCVPAYSFRIKSKPFTSQELPGPASYKVKVKPILRQAPTYSLRIKPTELPKFNTPGNTSLRD